MRQVGENETRCLGTERLLLAARHPSLPPFAACNLSPLPPALLLPNVCTLPDANGHLTFDACEHFSHALMAERSEDYWRHCGNTPQQAVIANFLPTGAERAHPREDGQ